MQEKALEKLSDEMAKSSNNSYNQIVGDFLTKYVLAHPEAAEKILASGKTIAGSMSAMRSEAEKHKNGNCAVLSDEEGFRVVLKYFGIEDTPAPAKPALAVIKGGAADFNVNIDDFLR